MEHEQSLFESTSLTRRGAPQSWEYAVHYPKAEQRERVLADTNTKDPKAYVLRQQQIEDDTRHGLYLPAPSSIAYTIDVPSNAKFHGELVLIPPEAADPAQNSDGASLELSIKDDSGNKVNLLNIDAIEGEYQTIDVSLADYAGQSIELVLESQSGPNNDYDYLFIADPIVYQPKADPKRVVWVFIDTLRQDHLSMYGYERRDHTKTRCMGKSQCWHLLTRSFNSPLDPPFCSNDGHRFCSRKVGCCSDTAKATSRTRVVHLVLGRKYLSLQ